MTNKRLINQWAVVTACTLTLSVAACGTDTQSSKAQPVTAVTDSIAASNTGTLDTHRAADISFYKSFRLEGVLSVGYYASIAEGVADSTAVVTAEVIDVRMSRTVRGDEIPDDVVHMTGVVLRPVEILAGSLPDKFSKQLTVEFLSGPTADVADPVAELRKNLPTGKAVWFLHRKGTNTKLRPGAPSLPPDETDYFRVISPQGLFAQGPDNVVAPLVETGPELKDLATEGTSHAKLSDIAAKVRAVKE